jgi:hypothetical protein
MSLETMINTIRSKSGFEESAGEFPLPDFLSEVNRNKIALPDGVTRKDIYVQVQFSNELRSDDTRLETNEVICNALQEIFFRIYTASKVNSRFSLDVFVFVTSDGGMSGTFSAEKAWLGQAELGLAWSLCATESHGNTEAAVYDGGVVVGKHQLEYAEFINPFRNEGEWAIVEKLAPQCALEIVSKIGIGSTKYYMKTPEWLLHK